MKTMKKNILAGSLAILIIALFATSTVSAATIVSSADYPEIISIDEPFIVEVAFEYEYALDCLHGDYIWLQYDYGWSPETYWFTLEIEEPISDIKPSTVSITVVTSSMNLAINDIFRFRIKYVQGLDDAGIIYNQGIKYSANFDILVDAEDFVPDDPEDPDIPAPTNMNIIIPIITTSLIVIIRRIKLK